MRLQSGYKSLELLLSAATLLAILRAELAAVHASCE